MKEVINISRRKFVKNLGKYSTALVLAMHLPGLPAFSKNHKWSSDAVFNPNAFVFLYPDGKCELVVSRSEMGQGVRTSMSAIIADEMEADWSFVKVLQADGDPKYGNQNTDGSRSVRTLFLPLRKMGASAREMLREAAAELWRIPVSACMAEKHFVYQKGTDKKLFYGDLVEKASQLTPPVHPRLKTPAQFKYIGKSLRGVDVKDITHGKARFGLDVRLPGMLFAAISRPPSPFGKMKAYQKQEAAKIAGVRRIVEVPRVSGPFGSLGGLAVVADTTWAALQAKKKLKIEWELGPNGNYDTDVFMEKLTQRVMQPAKVVKKTGNVEQAFHRAAKKMKAVYRVPHLPHVSMETPNTVAWVTDGQCEIWSPTQAPQRIRKDAAAYLGVSEDQVVVHVTLLGGGFGRKSQVDFALEAVILSKITRSPIQVVWSREDDLRHDYYHTISAQFLEASLDKAGNVTGWLHRLAFPSISSTFQPGTAWAASWELASGATNLPFDIPNVQVENAKAEAFVRIGWLRSVCNIFQGFAVNVFADELAWAAGADPLDYRLKLLGADRQIEFGHSAFKLDTGRLKNVLKMAAEEAGWGKTLPKGYGMGLAVHYSFLSYVAAVVLLKVEGNRVSVEKVNMAVDCGQTVNTDTITAQMEGSVIFGISLAFFGKISVKKGVVQQSNFHNFLLVRMPQSPEIEVQIVKNNEPPTGIGEPGVPVIAPAIVNAIYAVTGKRYRDLPLAEHSLSF
jgi:isoquinoline 1-oxidoreductase beta subunit